MKNIKNKVMGNIMEKQTTLKNISVKEKLKLFYVKNKNLINSAAIATLTGISIYASIKCTKYSKENDQLKDELESEKAFHESDVLEKNARIAELETLCDEKDAGYLYLASDAMRHGSSYGGFEMSRYKNEVKPLSE